MANLRRIASDSILIAIGVALVFLISYRISTSWLRHGVKEEQETSGRKEAAIQAEATVQEKASIKERDRREAIYAAQYVGWRIHIEQRTQDWGGVEVGDGSGLGSEIRTILSSQVGEFSGKEGGQGHFKIIEVIDDDHIRVRFLEPLVYVGKRPLVFEAVIGHEPLCFSTATICGGTYFWYTLMKVDHP